MFVNKFRTKTIGTLTEYVLPQQSSNEAKVLTIAPVCKIDTYEDIINKNSDLCLESTKSIVRYKTFQSKPKPNSKYRCLEERQFRYQPLQWDFCLDYKNQSPHLFIQPNARIAYFRSVIEKEILPLKIILEDLLTKCTSFGLLKNYIYSKKYTNYYKCISNNSASFENKIHCNRVVYSIVFDE